MKTRRGPLSYWLALLRFAHLGALPHQPKDVPVWAMCVPYRLWGKPVTHQGKTFADIFFSRLEPALRERLPLRGLYLFLLWIWPLVAFWRSLRRGWGAWRYYRGALAFPELAIFHPAATYTEAEWTFSRPDFAFSMLYAWEMQHGQPDYLRLDDKRHFLRVAQEAGLPLPRCFTKAEAMRRGGTFVVKDPDLDLGRGVDLYDAQELQILEPDEDPIIQEHLKNHPTLVEVFSAEAPLSTLRVTTTLDANSLEPVISRCAVRIGRAGAVADNTAQGGIWSRVDLETGEIQPGVTTKTFGVYEQGGAIRFPAHPDSKKVFAGLKVPYWEEGRRMALEAHRRLAPDAPSLGWDVALAAGGPVFLEVNVWTVIYDYDPQTDALEPGCRLILRRLQRSSSR